MNFRTDLAVEVIETLTRLEVTSDFNEEEVLSGYGIDKTVRQVEDVTVTCINIKSETGSKALNRPQGKYITLDLPPFSDNDRNTEEKAKIVGAELVKLLSKELADKVGTILVVGLGNNEVTPDALGPRAANMVLATRHIREEFARTMELDDLRSTAVFSPGVLGQTGVESSEMVRGICNTIKPRAVIVIDALAARSLDRLGTTIQLCDTGISPGSGVGNIRRPLNVETLGIPVISVGVPTVVDGATFVSGLIGEEAFENTELKQSADMMVTPKEIDLIIDRASRLVAMGINSALQPEYSPLALVNIAN